MSTYEEDQVIVSLPIASLSSLPIEIKSIIVNLAQEQDENYKSRVKSYNKEELKLTKKVLKDNKWRGKSLNALFLVNKEFSNLAAVHIFKILRSKQVDGDLFPYEILPRRSNLIRSVQFNSESFLPETLLYLFILSNLESLEFDYYAVTSLFGDLVQPGVSGTKKQNSHYSALVAAGRRVKRLNIDAIEVSQLNGILAAFPVLEKLMLDLPRIEEEGEEDEMLDLGTKLSQYSLESLKLVFDEGMIPKSWTELDWKSSTSLKCLECDLSDELIALYANCFSFLNKFTSLKYLKLLIYIEDTSIPQHASKKYAKLVQLTQLNIRCAVIQLSPLLLHFTASPVEFLWFDTWQNNLTTEEISSIELALMQFVDQHQQTLKKIEICDRVFEFNFSTLVTLCSRHQIVLIFTSWIGTCISLDYPLSTQNRFKYCRPILEKVLDFGKNKLVELENDNDVEGLKEMFNNCKWLRASLAEKED